MDNYTKGPWLFRGKSNGVFTAPELGTVYKYGKLIFQFDDLAEPSDADLALVLAAPDLLEAAELVSAALAKFICPLDIEFRALEKMRAAIAKAKDAEHGN